MRNKKFISIIIFVLLLTFVFPSFADLQSTNENKTTTEYRMEPLLKKYCALLHPYIVYLYIKQI